MSFDFDEISDRNTKGLNEETDALLADDSKWDTRWQKTSVLPKNFIIILLCSILGSFLGWLFATICL